MTLNSLSKSALLVRTNTVVCTAVLYKAEDKIPALIIENPTDLEAIIKHAVLHNCEYIVMASGNKAEILYTKGNHTGKMKVGLSNTVNKTEPVFGIRLDGEYIEFGSPDDLYFSASPFVVPKS